MVAHIPDSQWVFYTKQTHFPSYDTRIASASNISLPPKHSLKASRQVYSNKVESSSYYGAGSLPLTSRYQEDTQNPRYRLLYNIIGSNYHASCPELLAPDGKDKDTVGVASRASESQQVQSRSSHVLRPAPQVKQRSLIGKFRQIFTEYALSCLRCFDRKEA